MEREVKEVNAQKDKIEKMYGNNLKECLQKILDGLWDLGIRPSKNTKNAKDNLTFNFYIIAHDYYFKLHNLVFRKG